MAMKALTSPQFMRDPHPEYARMRANGPLMTTKLPIIGTVTFTTTYQGAVDVLKNSQTFAQRSSEGRIAGMRWWLPKIFRTLSQNMLTQDEPAHTRLRTIVDTSFQRRNVLALEGKIEAIAQALLDAAESAQPVDLVTQFARQLPLAVISELLGLPEKDRSKFVHWASSFRSGLGIFSLATMIPRISALAKYLEDRIDLARVEPETGLIGELVRAEHDEGCLSGEEALAMVFLLLVAGFETTTHMISGGTLALLQHGEQRDLLTSDWSHLDLTVEEVLRHVSPVQMTKPRHALADTVVDGKDIPAGTVVMALLGAANADPAVFDLPERFDITRRPNRHIAFGTGIHFCLGHQLARLEARIAFRVLFERYPALRLAVPDSALAWHGRIGLRALKALPVHLT